jgi:hypothetical protein
MPRSSSRSSIFDIIIAPSLINLFDPCCICCLCSRHCIYITALFSGQFGRDQRSAVKSG